MTMMTTTTTATTSFPLLISSNGCKVKGAPKNFFFFFLSLFCTLQLSTASMLRVIPSLSIPRRLSSPSTNPHAASSWTRIERKKRVSVRCIHCTVSTLIASCRQAERERERRPFEINYLVSISISSFPLPFCSSFSSSCYFCCCCCCCCRRSAPYYSVVLLLHVLARSLQSRLPFYWASEAPITARAIYIYLFIDRKDMNSPLKGKRAKKRKEEKIQALQREREGVHIDLYTIIRTLGWLADHGDRP